MRDKNTIETMFASIGLATEKERAHYRFWFEPGYGTEADSVHEFRRFGVSTESSEKDNDSAELERNS